MGRRAVGIGQARRRVIPVWTLALLLVLGAACGEASGSDGIATLGKPASTGGEDDRPAGKKDPQEAFLEFARCMRKHGVDMPDPTVEGNGEGGRIKVEIGGSGGDGSKLPEADAKCRHLLNGAAGGAGAPKMDPQAQDAFLKYARCMRENGIDMPDPDPSKGGLIFRAEDGPGETPEKMEKADRACRHLISEVVKGGPAAEAAGGK